VTSDSRTAVIVALYQSDRSDNANTGNAAMAVVGGAITYVGLTSLFGAGGQSVGGVRLLPFLPIPLWALIIFYSILIGVSVLRSSSIRLLEDLLVKEANLPGEADMLGLTGTECVTNVSAPNGRWEHRVSVVTFNVIALGSALAYTVFCLVRGHGEIGPVVLIVLILVYAVLVALTLLCWRATFRVARDRENRRTAVAQRA
jgi:hypothetical protein